MPKTKPTTSDTSNSTRKNTVSKNDRVNSENTIMMRSFSYYMPASLDEKLEIYAKDHCVSKSVVITSLLVDFFAGKDIKATPKKKSIASPKVKIPC